MKTKNVIILLAMLMTSIQAAIAQTSIEPIKIYAGYTKTLNLIFPFPIKSKDKGSKDIIIQQTDGAENILQVKATKRGFEETNITVVTADGKLYSFLVNYSDTPHPLNLNLESKGSGQTALFSEGDINQGKLLQLARDIAGRVSKGNLKKDQKDKVKLELTDLYIYKDDLFFRLAITNESNIGYKISQLRYFIRDQKTQKRTAVQELEQLPVLSFQDTLTIPARSKNVRVLAFPKFSLAKDKVFTIQLLEENGGRNLQLDLKNKRFLSAEPISALP